MREDYLGDLDVLFAHLGISRAVLLGNSLGGVNAYQFAVRHPDYVRALIVEDIGAVIGDDTSFALSWAGVFKTCQDLEERIGPRFFLSQGLGTRIRWRVASRVRAQGHGAVADIP
jgi:esterase